MHTFLLAAGLLLPSPVQAADPPMCDAIDLEKLDEPATLDALTAVSTLSLQCVKDTDSYCVVKCYDLFDQAAAKLQAEKDKKKELDARKEAARAASIVARDHLGALHGKSRPAAPAR